MNHSFFRYALQRVASLLFTMLLISLLVFAAFEFISGNPAEILLGTQATPEKVAELMHEMGLDRPFLIRYFSWLIGFFTGNFGVSYSYRIPVWQLIAPKITVTLWIAFLAFVIILTVSLLIFFFSPAWGKGKGETVRSAVNQLFMAIPSFFSGILFTWIFSTMLHWFVHGDFPSLHEDFFTALRTLFFAALTIAVPRIAATLRMLRSTVSAEMKKDYVRTAYARGNSGKTVLRRHVLKNASSPVITFLGQTMAEIVAGVIIAEQVFALPGLGRLLVASVANRDYPVVEVIVVLLAFWVVLFGALADMVNRTIDPRLRSEGGTTR